MRYGHEQRRRSKAPLILLVMRVTTAVPLLALAQEADAKGEEGVLDESPVTGINIRLAHRPTLRAVQEKAVGTA